MIAAEAQQKLIEEATTFAQSCDSFFTSQLSKKKVTELCK